ncbi:ankyrin repeat-containing domain protein [Nemania abortiva]|nr:ankyrin repeat-containing domain protein [Nemania abortiva]
MWLVLSTPRGAAQLPPSGKLTRAPTPTVSTGPRRSCLQMAPCSQLRHTLSYSLVTVCGYLGTVRLIQQITTDKNIKRQHRLAALWAAAEAGHDDVVRALFVESHKKAAKTLLFKAVGRKDEVAFRTLLQAGADPEVREQWGHTPLSLSILIGDTAKGIVQIFIEEGVDLEATNKDGDTLLMQAARGGDKGIGIVQLLLEAGADIEAGGSMARTPLMEAISAGDDGIGIVQLLLELNADIEARDKLTYTPLMVAASGVVAGDRVEGVVWLLLHSGADIEARTDDGHTPLMVAAQNAERSAEIVEILLEAGASIDATSDDGDTALSLAEAGAIEEAYAYVPEVESEAESEAERNRRGWHEWRLGRWRDVIQAIERRQ